MDLGFIWTGDNATSYIVRTPFMLGMWEERMVGQSGRAFADFDTPGIIRDITRQIHVDRQGLRQRHPRVFSPID